MGREVRRVPANWEHPTDFRGNPKPLYDHSFAEAWSDWEREWKEWQAGNKRSYAKGGPEFIPHDEDRGIAAFCDWHGHPPAPNNYRPAWTEAERTHLQMYENTTEGTPISPVMPTAEELAHWLADNNASAFGGQGASYESWLRVCNGGYAPSAVMIGGHLMSGVEGLAANGVT